MVRCSEWESVTSIGVGQRRVAQKRARGSKLLRNRRSPVTLESEKWSICAHYVAYAETRTRSFLPAGIADVLRKLTSLCAKPGSVEDFDKPQEGVNGIEDESRFCVLYN